MKTNEIVHPQNPAQETDPSPAPAPAPSPDSSATLEQDPASPPGLPGSRVRTGKIARLPLKVRDELNRRLRNGEQGKVLLPWLNEMTEVKAVLEAEFQSSPINQPNLSHWRKGGYLSWEKTQAAQQAVVSFMEEISGLQGAAKEKEGLTELLAFYLAAQTALEIKQLESMAPGPEKDKLRRELLKTVVTLRRGDHEMERLRIQRERYGLRHKTKEEREAEFWKWADENINRDEFCRRRCFTAAEREAAIKKILGITAEDRGEPDEMDSDMPSGMVGSAACPGCKKPCSPPDRDVHPCHNCGLRYYHDVSSQRCGLCGNTPCLGEDAEPPCPGERGATPCQGGCGAACQAACGASCHAAATPPNAG